MAPSSCSSPVEQSTGGLISSSADQGTMATAAGALSADEEHFMYHFKVLPCPLTEEHCQEDCPYAHPSEKATRRDPRVYPYTGVSCPSYRKGSCKDGDACQYAHGVFEVWLHPSRFRTELCKDGPSCTRKCCFFAHTAEQLREAPAKDPSAQMLAQKAQKAALSSRSTNSSSSSGSGSFCAGAKTTSLSSSDSASNSMLRAAVRNAYSPANGSSASGKQALYSRTSTPAHGSFNSLQQLEAFAGSAYGAQAGAGNIARAAAGALLPQSSTRFVLQQASSAAALAGVGGSMTAAAAASAPQLTNTSASRMLFDLGAPADSASGGSRSAGFGSLKPPHGQHLHTSVGPLQGHAGSCGLQRMDLAASSLPASTTSAGSLPVPAALALASSTGLSHSSSTGYAAAAALELLATQQKELTNACMLQQLLLHSQQQQQQQQQLLLEAAQQQQDQQQGHLFLMWSAAFNAAKGVGLQPNEAAACADCAVEQAVGTLVPQLVASTTSAAPLLQGVAAPSAAPGLFGTGLGGRDVTAPECGAFGFSALAQQGLQAALQQQMLFMHAAADLKQGSGGFAQADGLMGAKLGDMLAGIVSGLNV